MKMTLPQSRPARTLVLIFMVVFLGDEWTDPEPQRSPREAMAAPASFR
jgi:hypothetical protein